MNGTHQPLPKGVPQSWEPRRTPIEVVQSRGTCPVLDDIRRLGSCLTPLTGPPTHQVMMVMVMIDDE